MTWIPCSNCGKTTLNAVNPCAKCQEKFMARCANCDGTGHIFKPRSDTGWPSTVEHCKQCGGNGIVINQPFDPENV